MVSIFTLKSFGKNIKSENNKSFIHRLSKKRLRPQKRRNFSLEPSDLTGTGGKPSTWFPPERLVEHLYTHFRRFLLA